MMIHVSIAKNPNDTFSGRKPVVVFLAGSPLCCFWQKAIVEMMSLSSSWSIEAWCADQERRPAPVLDSLVHLSAQTLLDALSNATVVHPFCTAFNDATYGLPGCPAQGPLLHKDHLESFYDVIVTAIAISVPSFLAMGELWLRLFASLIAPVGVVHLLFLASKNTRTTTETTTTTTGTRKSDSHKNTIDRTRTAAPLWIKMITTASSIILLTDTLYVYEFGASVGAMLLLASLGLGSYTSTASSSQWRIWRLFCLASILVTALLIVQPDGTLQLGNAQDMPRNVPEGLYYDNETGSATSIVEHWAESTRTYDEASRTPWFPTGDSRTGLPFLLHKVGPVPWMRRWLPMASDGEVVALDIAFPRTNGADDDDGSHQFYHDASRPLYIVFHGLNGGSQEEYVRDFALARIREGSTVVVMVARGLMDLPIRGWNIFHGARWTDAFESIAAVRQAAGEDQFIAAVGYSMGAIILSNVMTHQPAVNAAVAISGGLDMRPSVDFARAMRLWQPLLVPELRDTFVVGKWGERVRERLTTAELKSLMRATHVTGVDKSAVVAYNGYRDILDYYADMSALGDIPVDEYDKDHFDPSRRM
jgi:predicted alpha/beta-fold hydrolase